LSLADRSALVIGAGGLGCPVVLGLASAGVGRITLMDDDRVDPTNLARQMLLGEADLGEHKAVAAQRAIKVRFPGVEVRPLLSRFGRDHASQALVAGHDLVIDGSDNFPTRFAANDLCVTQRKPLVHGAAIRWQGQMLTILPGETPCLRCVFETEPPPGAAPTCAEAGVIAPLVGVMGGWMAHAAVEWLSGRRPATAGTMRVFDAWRGRERMVPVGRDPGCAACGVGAVPC
jgi:molybdopterin/thiamine biosynthesis adenylyltransferase